MSKCILCTNNGKKRKYFLKEALLCDADYVSFLEFLINDMNDKVTEESSDDAYRHLEISLKPEAQIATHEPYDDEPDTISMGM